MLLSNTGQWSVQSDHRTWLQDVGSHLVMAISNGRRGRTPKTELRHQLILTLSQQLSLVRAQVDQRLVASQQVVRFGDRRIAFLESPNVDHLIHIADLHAKTADQLGVLLLRLQFIDDVFAGEKKFDY